MGLVKNRILKGMLSEGRQGEKAAGLDFQNGFWITPLFSLTLFPVILNDSEESSWPKPNITAFKREPSSPAAPQDDI